MRFNNTNLEEKLNLKELDKFCPRRLLKSIKNSFPQNEIISNNLDIIETKMNALNLAILDFIKHLDNLSHQGHNELNASKILSVINSNNGSIRGALLAARKSTQQINKIYLYKVAISRGSRTAIFEYAQLEYEAGNIQLALELFDEYLKHKDIQENYRVGKYLYEKCNYNEAFEYLFEYYRLNLKKYISECEIMLIGMSYNSQIDSLNKLIKLLIETKNGPALKKLAEKNHRNGIIVDKNIYERMIRFFTIKSEDRPFWFYAVMQRREEIRIERQVQEQLEKIQRDIRNREERKRREKRRKDRKRKRVRFDISNKKRNKRRRY